MVGRQWGGIWLQCSFKYLPTVTDTLEPQAVVTVESSQTHRPWENDAGVIRWMKQGAGCESLMVVRSRFQWEEYAGGRITVGYGHG